MSCIIIPSLFHKGVMSVLLPTSPLSQETACEGELCSRENPKEINIRNKVTGFINISAIIHCPRTTLPFPLPDAPVPSLLFCCPSSVTTDILCHSCCSYMLCFPEMLHSAFVFCFETVYLSNMCQITTSDKAVDASLNCSSSETHCLAIYTKLVHCVSTF